MNNESLQDNTTLNNLEQLKRRYEGEVEIIKRATESTPAVDSDPGDAALLQVSQGLSYMSILDK